MRLRLDALARARVDDGLERPRELLAAVRVHLRDAQLLAEPIRLLVGCDPGREGRDLEQDAVRLAEVDRAEVVAVLHRGDATAGVGDPLLPRHLVVARSTSSGGRTSTPFPPSCSPVTTTWSRSVATPPAPRPPASRSTSRLHTSG